MIAIVCVDERNGMMFHGRRQSQDRVMREDMLRECRGRRLYMDTYSGDLFKNMSHEETEIVIADDFARRAGDGDSCFFEKMEVERTFLTDRDESRIEAIIMYHWNRRYPADTYFPISLSDGCLSDREWKLLRMEEFRGSSHERITKEVYQRI